MTALKTYNNKRPSITDLALRTRQRIPRFACDYLEGGIAAEYALHRNRDDLDNVLLWSRFLQDMSSVDSSCSLFGHHYDLGIGIAPVGLGDMMWPGMEKYLAQAAQQANIPYVLSTMSTTSMEEISTLAKEVAWFQLYVPQAEAATLDLIRRAEASGFNALVVTVDIPVGAKRDRELKNGLILPFRLTPEIIWQIIRHPEWAVRTMLNGIPDFVNLQPYLPQERFTTLSQFLSSFLMHGVTPERIRMIRNRWQGPLIIKGLQRTEEIETVIKLGADGVIISNHGGRQLDAAPSSVQALQQLPEAIRNKITIMLDSGIRSGLDVIRSKALGAECCFSGRSFFYGACAEGADGGRQVIEIFRDEIIRTLQQLGCKKFTDMNADWLQP